SSDVCSSDLVGDQLHQTALEPVDLPANGLAGIRACHPYGQAALAGPGLGEADRGDLRVGEGDARDRGVVGSDVASTKGASDHGAVVVRDVGEARDAR